MEVSYKNCKALIAYRSKFNRGGSNTITWRFVPLLNKLQLISLVWLSAMEKLNFNLSLPSQATDKLRVEGAHWKDAG